MVALRVALESVTQLEGTPAKLPAVVICIDSQAALATLEGGAGAQTMALGAEVWRFLLVATETERHVYLQWVPAHCSLPGDEKAEVLAKETSSMLQGDVPVDIRTITKAVSRSASKVWRHNWPGSFFRRIMGDRAPKPVVLESRDDAVNVHQLRAGHWSRSSSYLHRIGRRP